MSAFSGVMATTPTPARSTSTVRLKTSCRPRDAQPRQLRKRPAVAPHDALPESPDHARRQGEDVAAGRLREVNQLWECRVVGRAAEHRRVHPISRIALTSARGPPSDAELPSWPGDDGTRDVEMAGVGQRREREGTPRELRGEPRAPR